MRCSTAWVGVLVSVLVLALDARPARADEPQPWTVGVTAEQKAEARALLDAGNELFLARKYADALEQYRQAVKTWAHPAIRFNIVRCLVLLEKTLEAYEQLELALAYGAAPFDDTIYTEALGYDKLLSNQIGVLEVSCKQPDVALTLDGQPLPACPGTHSRRVLPGQHQVVGTRKGYVPRTVEIVVLGGTREQTSIELQTLTEVTRDARIIHRWAPWVPWAVVGAGFAAGGIGALLRLKANGDMEDYGRLVNRTCDRGCMSGEVDRSLESRARLENGLAIASFTAGAAALVTGGVMLYLNRGRTVYDVEVAPVRGGGSISWSGRF